MQVRKTARAAYVLVLVAFFGLCNAGAAQRAGDAQSRGAAEASSAGLSEAARSFLLSISAPYDLNGRFIDPSASKKFGEADCAGDQELLALFATMGMIDELHELHDDLVARAKNSSAIAQVQFAARALKRLVEAISDDGEVPIELVGDAYVSESAALPAWKRELQARCVGRALCNKLAADLSVFSDSRRGHSAGITRKGGIVAEFVLEGQHQGFVRVHNKNNEELKNVLILVRSCPQPNAAKRVKVVDDFGLLPLVLGGTLSSVKDRKDVNELLQRYTAMDQVWIVFASSIPARGSLEMLACESPQFLMMLKQAQVSLWSDERTVLNREVKGLADVQGLIAAGRR